MNKKEYVYLGHDNYIDLILMANGSAQNLSGITKMTLTFDTTKISSANQASDPILWNQAGYQTGEIRIFLGKQSLTPGSYEAPLIVYDASDPDGIVWDIIPIIVVAQLEGTS